MFFRPEGYRRRISNRQLKESIQILNNLIHNRFLLEFNEDAILFFIKGGLDPLIVYGGTNLYLSLKGENRKKKGSFKKTICQLIRNERIQKHINEWEYFLDTIQFGDLEMFLKIFKEGEEKMMKNEKNEIMNRIQFINRRCEGSILHFASKHKSIEIAKVLIEKGMNVNELNEDGETPIHSACYSKSADMVELLINSGGDIHKLDSFGLSPLHIASKCGLIETASLLLINGIDVNAKSKYNGITPIYLASKYNHIDVLKILIEAGGDVNISDIYEHSPLHISCESKFVEVTNLLVNNGANISKRDKEGFTPRSEDPRIIEILNSRKYSISLSNMIPSPSSTTKSCNIS